MPAVLPTKHKKSGKMKNLAVMCVLALLSAGLFAQEKVQLLESLENNVQQDTVRPGGDTLKVSKEDSVVVKTGDKVVIIYDDGTTEVLDEKADKNRTGREEDLGYTEHYVFGEVYDGPDRTEVRIGSKPFLQVIDDDDTVVVRLGKKGVKIIETPDGSLIRVERDDAWKKERERKKKRFNGNWRGIEFGMNSYLNTDHKFPPGFLSIYDGKAWNVNLNFFQYSFNFTRNGRLGMVTGIGIRLQNYRFANNNSIMKDSTGFIVEKPYTQNLKKSKLIVDYLTVPAIIEFHTGRYRNGFRIGLGVIGSLKCRSLTKVKWYEEGDKKKEKNKGDYNISPLDYALTARLGVGAVEVYANYSMIPLFKKGQGPEVYPLSVGLGIKF
jgi:hypothetical protein